MSDEELQRRVSKLEHEHSTTRWWLARVDRDLAEIGGTQVEHGQKLDRVGVDVAELKTGQQELLVDVQELKGSVDSIKMQLVSLTQMVGQVLERLPAPPESSE